MKSIAFVKIVMNTYSKNISTVPQSVDAIGALIAMNL